MFQQNPIYKYITQHKRVLLEAAGTTAAGAVAGLPGAVAAGTVSGLLEAYQYGYGRGLVAGVDQAWAALAGGGEPAGIAAESGTIEAQEVIELNEEDDTPEHVKLFELAIEGERPRELVLPEFLPYHEYAALGNPFKNGDLLYSMGMMVNGSQSKLVQASVFDLCHSIMGGAPGSGKSVGARSLVYQTLLSQIDPRTEGKVQIGALDLESVTFNAKLFDGLPCLFGGRVITDESDLFDFMDLIKEEYRRRAVLYNQVNGYPEKLQEYNALVPESEQLPIIVVFLEEWSTLSYAGGKQFLPRVAELVWKVRKFGIYLVFIGQDFTKEVIGPMRDSLNARIYFQEMPWTTRQMLQFGDYTLADNRPGHALFKLGNNIREIQSLFVEKTELITLAEVLRGRNKLLAA